MNFPDDEPLWVDEKRLLLLAPPTVVRKQLTQSGSLTKTITQSCDQRFKVAVIQQQFATVELSERHRLHLSTTATANIRTVLLHCGNQPWVFARTTIPHYALRRSLRRLIQLGNRSLGAVLHRSRAMERSNVEYACFTQQHTLFQQATRHLKQPPEMLWGRRILYRIDGDPVLVNELFLPCFPFGTTR